MDFHDPMVTEVPRSLLSTTESQGVTVPPINRTHVFCDKTTTALAHRKVVGYPCPWGPGLSKCSVVTVVGTKQSRPKAKRVRMKQKVVVQAVAKSHAE